MPAPEADPESGNGQLALQTPHFAGCMPSFVSTLRVFCYKAGMFQSPGFKIFIYLSSTPYPRVNKWRIFRTFIVGNTIVDERGRCRVCRGLRLLLFHKNQSPLQRLSLCLLWGSLHCRPPTFLLPPPYLCQPEDMIFLK